MQKDLNQLSFLIDTPPQNNNIVSEYANMSEASYEQIKDYYENVNKDISHKSGTDDICTPIECVKVMLDYIPDELWDRKNLKILDPCCGNGNFGAYCKFKTNLDNIWFNEINPVRLANCKAILNPKHINNEDAFNMHGDFVDSWDLIMANPPYSGGGNKNRSISNLFLQYSIDILKNKGYLCFITPNNWMTYNNDNPTLKKLLNEGSFIVIDNNAKKFFPQIGSSFTIIVWQKGVFDNKTKIINNYLLKDVQQNIVIPKAIKFLPLYISQPILNIIQKIMQVNANNFNYRCDLHNFTRKDLLSDIKTGEFIYPTIHTPNKTRFACIKQDIYDKWLIIIPLSMYYRPYIVTKSNTTQSVGYFEFDKKELAEDYLQKITQPHFKLIIHLTRYGNFNNIMVLKHLKFDKTVKFTNKELAEIEKLSKLIKY